MASSYCCSAAPIWSLAPYLSHRPMTSRLAFASRLPVVLTVLAAPLHAQTTDGAAATDPSKPAELSQIVVYGNGAVRAEQTVSAQAIDLLAPGSSPLKAIARLPGVALQSSDPFGTYELGTRLSVRGFNQSQMGYTLDGVPLGDMFYNTWNGLHISRAIAAENIDRVVFAQGAGGLGVASTSNLGGSLQFHSRPLEDKAGGEVAATYGSDATTHVFARAETGQLSTGTRLSISGVYHDADKWKGSGTQPDRKLNTKWEQEIGRATLTTWINYSLHRERNYADLSPATLRTIGYDLDFLAPDYATAILLSQVDANRKAAAARKPLPFPSAGTQFPAPYKTVNDTYYDSGGIRRDWLGASTLEVPVGDWLSLKGTYYRHTDKGSGGIYTPAVFSPDGFPLSVRTTEYGVDRDGALLEATATLGAHSVQATYWYEDNRGSTDRNYYAASPSHRPDVTDFLSDPFRSDFLTDLTTITNQVSLSDRWSVNDRLTLDAGFKGAKVRNGIVTRAGTPFINGRIEAKDWFQPQVGAAWRVGGSEFFANYAENMRAFQSSFRGPFGTTQAGFEAIRGTLKPETSRTVEGGWRFDADALRGSLTLYHVKFENRLLAAFSSANILGNPSVLQNVGSVTSQGVEAGLTWRIDPALSLIGSYSYNDSQYDDDTVNGTTTVPTRGVRPVDTPEQLAKLELNYDNGTVFGNLSGAYTSKRNVTYTGDVTTPGYTLVDATLGYRLAGGIWDNSEIQLNATNLLDKRYIAALGSGQFFNTAASLNNTMQAGAPLQVFVTLRKKF
ncbi:TonB-dependent receptor [Pseudoxanthomonas winnipegensis]|jgi:iron complex outermembrane receptor protein|uniref:TonB-dependent receptor n=2 Tax=Pseudoxanthomonas winnipegensis TaxID=2480810 RepID=A0A4Q8L4F9_9GAMM|nr:TonB-dependent receptor [Pseudoxanthomonas winnipegensis]